MGSRYSGVKPLLLLTKRQEQVAGLIACGMAKKEVADYLNITTATVDATLRPVYQKTGCQKINELAGWWISRQYELQIDFKELKKQLIAISFITLMFFQMCADPAGIITVRRTRTEKEFETEIVHPLKD